MSRQFDTYVLLALCIGGVSFAGSIWQGTQFFGDFPPTNSSGFSAWARAIFGQASIVLAMMSAILLGRQALSSFEPDLLDEAE